jgi:tRNA threonylcarbamoyl adenosine modification protein (Sua5/YciO/YrdC/YwlC family)
MAESIDVTAENFDRNRAITNAVTALNEGNLIIAPLEFGYVFLADAFNHKAVQSIHRLRYDPRGVATQVIVGDIDTARGITREFGTNVTSLCERFWPGMLTINIAPALGLVWDLGDARTLEEISIRVPSADLVREIARASGPLAVASATLAGQKPKLDTSLFPARDSDYAFLFDAGELPAGEPSTVISVKNDGIYLTRVGAISLASLREVTPNIAVPA